MTGVSSDESGVGRPMEENSSNDQLCEWRSSDQIEDGTPSTSPPYWDSEDDDSGGPNPSELYGKYTWKIDKFSQINKRELRSNAFEVGGYKWYILIYPQGCDVCNHLSLFLCVANHDKLLPGWSHFAQFTIAVVNKDPKKSKYSDTLHRFWKKEHDWGWKKFMELSKVLDGFIDSDTLIIKAQVQVIRERDRPFRCLDVQYRRELVRVYLTNVEQICRRFVEDRRNNLGKLIEDKAKWASFRYFWLAMDQTSRRRMTREKTDSILKVVVKHFFIEKEVTSTLVMDSLYSGLKALIGQTNKEKKNKEKYPENEKLPVPVIRVEKEMFVLVDDVLLLLERAAIEPLPPKDEKGPQNRTKDAALGEEFAKDSIENDERRLTELGRRTIEIFVLAHIFNKIEVAHQHAVSLQIQEELIREEDIEQKIKRGALEKEKKSKKKQGKQKKNNRKGKDKGKDDKADSSVRDKIEEEMVLEKVEDVSDMSDSNDCGPELLPQNYGPELLKPGSEDCGSKILAYPEERDGTSSGLSVVQNGVEGINLSAVDDSSSTCSTDSVRSVNIALLQKGNSHNLKNQKSSRNNQHKMELARPVEAMLDSGKSNDSSRKSKKVESSKAAAHTLQDGVNGTERISRKEEFHKNAIAKNVEVSSQTPPRSSSKNIPSPNLEPKINALISSSGSIKPSPNRPKQVDRATHLPNSAKNTATLTHEPKKSTPPNQAEKPIAVEKPVRIEKPSRIEKPATTEKPAIIEKPAKMEKPTKMEKPAKLEKPVVIEKPVIIEKPVVIEKTLKPSIPQAPIMSRPVSAPLIPGPRPSVSVVSMVQTAPILSRSVSATGRLTPETSSYVPQSYRNAIIGSQSNVTTANSNPSPYFQNQSYSQSPVITSAPLYRSDGTDSNPISLSFPSLGMANPSHNQRNQWMDSNQRDNNNSRTSTLNDIQSYEFPTGPSGRQTVASVDEFPHLDIIYDLLEEDQGVNNNGIQNFGNGLMPDYMNRNLSFPGSSDPTMSSGFGQSTSSCRFDRNQIYPDEYGFSLNPYDPNWDMVHQTGPRPYVNGSMDGSMLNQWQMADSNHLPFGSIGNAANNGYPYHIPDYANINAGVNGYTVFRPSNGL